MIHPPMKLLLIPDTCPVLPLMVEVVMMAVVILEVVMIPIVN